MKELENLKELYLDEIKRITKKGELTPADADAASKALEAIEKINCLCDKDDESKDWYSERYAPTYYHRGSMMPDLHSERRGRDSMGRYISRSRGETVHSMIEKLETMRMDAPDEATRMAIDQAITKLEAY